MQKNKKQHSVKMITLIMENDMNIMGKYKKNALRLKEN